jgi:hypothetical protein
MLPSNAPSVSALEATTTRAGSWAATEEHTKPMKHKAKSRKKAVKNPDFSIALPDDINLFGTYAIGVA